MKKEIIFAQGEFKISEKQQEEINLIRQYGGCVKLELVVYNDDTLPYFLQDNVFDRRMSLSEAVSKVKNRHNWARQIDPFKE